MSADRVGLLIRLGHAKNFAMPEEQIRTFMELLGDVPYDLLKGACVRLAKAQTYGYPTVGDIRSMADSIRFDQVSAIKALPAHNDADPSKWVNCKRCNDEPSSWLPPLWCNGSGKHLAVDVPFQRSHMDTAFCGLVKAHTPHSFTERCDCHRAPWREMRRVTKLSEDTRQRPRR